MANNSDINNHIIKGRLKDRFNDRAFSEDASHSHDKALDALDEANISAGLLMGSETHIGRKDQFHFHEEKERFDGKEQQEKRKKKYFERLFIRTYLDQLQQTLDAIDEQIDKIKARIEQTQMRLVENMRLFGHNENVIGKINSFMQKGEIERLPNNDLEDKELTQLLILMGYTPSEMTDSEVRKVLDKEAHRLRYENENLDKKIKTDTNRIDYDTQELEIRQKERDRLQGMINKTIAIANDDQLDDDAKEKQIEALSQKEQLTTDDLKAIYNEIDDGMEYQDTEVLNNVLDHKEISERGNNSALDETSEALFRPKP